MSNITNESFSDNPELDAVIAAYLFASERGEKPDQSQFIAQHPQLTRELLEFFADLNNLHIVIPTCEDSPALDQTVIGAATVGPQPGQILRGRYKLLENIGEGGMGSVWVAEQQRPVKRKVAIKLIKSGRFSHASKRSDRLWP